VLIRKIYRLQSAFFQKSTKCNVLTLQLVGFRINHFAVGGFFNYHFPVGGFSLGGVDWLTGFLKERV